MQRIDVDNLHVTHRMVYDIKPDFDGQELKFQAKKARQSRRFVG